jgi:hypothetical protein
MITPRLGMTISVLALAACGLSAGCGVTAAPRTPRPPPSRVERAQVTHEYPSPSPPRQAVAGAWRSPITAVEAFANDYINWTFRSVSADMRELAARSIGQARAATQLAAAQTANDYELQRGGIANTGTVEVDAPLSASVDEYVVVTRELTTASATTAYQGLQPAWHVAIATVTQVSRGWWVVSGWQPQS